MHILCAVTVPEHESSSSARWQAAGGQVAELERVDRHQRHVRAEGAADEPQAGAPEVPDDQRGEEQVPPRHLDDAGSSQMGPPPLF